MIRNVLFTPLAAANRSASTIILACIACIAISPAAFSQTDNPASPQDNTPSAEIGPTADANSTESQAPDEDAQSLVSFSPIPLIFTILAPLCLIIVLLRRVRRLPAKQLTPLPIPGTIALAAMIGIYLLQRVGVLLGQAMTLQQRETPADEDAVMPPFNFEELVFIQAAGYLFALFIVAWLALKEIDATRNRRRLNVPDPRPSLPVAAALGVASLVLFWPLVHATTFVGKIVFEYIQSTSYDAVGHVTLSRMMDRGVDIWFFAQAALVVVCAPIVEEVLYRGLFQRAIRSLGAGAWSSITIASVLFASVHIGAVHPYGVVALFVLSLGFGWIYEKTGRLTAPIAMHAAFNAGNLALAFLN